MSSKPNVTRDEARPHLVAAGLGWLLPTLWPLSHRAL